MTTAEGDGAHWPTAENPWRVEHWELEVLFRINYGAEPEAALTDTLLRWMEYGNLRPRSRRGRRARCAFGAPEGGGVCSGITALVEADGMGIFEGGLDPVSVWAADPAPHR
jgi:hypothetical protein